MQGDILQLQLSLRHIHASLISVNKAGTFDDESHVWKNLYTFLDKFYYRGFMSNTIPKETLCIFPVKKIGMDYGAFLYVLSRELSIGRSDQYPWLLCSDIIKWMKETQVLTVLRLKVSKMSFYSSSFSYIIVIEIFQFVQDVKYIITSMTRWVYPES